MVTMFILTPLLRQHISTYRHNQVLIASEWSHKMSEWIDTIGGQHSANVRSVPQNLVSPATGLALNTLTARLGKFAATCVSIVLTWQDRAVERQNLRSLSDHLRKDLGLSHSDILRETTKPFWRE